MTDLRPVSLNDVPRPADAQPIALQRVEEDHHLIAVFENLAHAEAAHQELLNAGLASDAAHVIDYRRELEEEAEAAGPWHAVRHLPIPAEDLHEYAESLDRGHALLVIRSRLDEHHIASQVLERSQALDFQAVLNRWREAGWIGTARNTPPPDIPHPPETPDSARIASILIQRGAAAAPQAMPKAPIQNRPEENPLVDGPEEIPPVGTVRPYAPQGQELPEPPLRTPRLSAEPEPEQETIRQFVADQMQVAERRPSSGSRVRIYRRNQPIPPE